MGSDSGRGTRPGPATVLLPTPSVGLGRTEGSARAVENLSGAVATSSGPHLANVKNVQMQNSHSAYYALSSKGSVGFQRVPGLVLKCRCS